MFLNKKSLSALLILCMLFVSVGCNLTRRPGPVPPTPAPAQPTPAQPMPAPNAPNTPATPNKDTTRAQTLAKRISNLKGINAATVVLSGKTAWVGVDLVATAEDRLTNKMKNDITALVKKEEKNIDRVFVTADADTVTRLKGISRDIAKGKPVSGFVQELNEIGRRITPSAK